MDLWSVCAHFPTPALLFESEGPLTALKIGCDENDEVPDSGAKSSVSQSVHSLSPVRLFAATHSSILAWRIPRTGTWRATVHGVKKEMGNGLDMT